ncbi:MAG: hypothetical protein ACXWHG_12100 [Thermoanaerobaculia bacterium]
MGDRDSAAASGSDNHPVSVVGPASELHLSAEITAQIVRTKATCPFIGTAVATGALPVRNDADNPLASIDDVRALGNTGGGDLGDLLQLFATGNHSRMRGRSGKLDTRTPPGLFSLEFPGSQGSHPGHSGILEGDPHTMGSGRLSLDDFERLARRARNGLITRTDVAHFIAENLHRDANSKVGSSAATSLLGDLNVFVRTLGPTLVKKLAASEHEAVDAHRDVEEKLTKLLGEDNLVGSAGEFGLLFAFFAHKPAAAPIDGEPAISVRDLQAMFVDKQFPEGWRSWKKSRADWVRNTTALLVSAGAEYLRLRKGEP